MAEVVPPLHCREVEEVVQREVDGSGNTYMTIAELKQQEAERRAGAGRPVSA